MRWRWGTEPVERSPGATQGPPDGRPAFIGRTDEQEAFRRLLAEVAAGSSAFVHLSGTARSGRRALLDQFRALAAESSAACSPLIDLEADAGLELDQVLERLAGGLEPEPDHFKGFFEATKRLRSREAGRPTRTSQAVAVLRAGSTVVTQVAGALPVKAVNAAIQSPLGDILTEHAETRRTLSAVSEEFVGGLLSLAAARGPLLLVFSDIDFAASSAKLLWLRRSLFPRIARARLIVAVSTEPQFELEDVGTLFGRTAQIQLDRFKESEAAQFLELHIGLAKDSPLGRAVLEDSDRFPERLAGYAQYFRDHPEARQSDRLPMEARDLTAGGLASGLLSRISDPFLRDVVLHAAPLRWFNAELLNGIEGVCGLAPAEGGRHAAGLLELGMRPSWVTNLGGGWGIDVDTRRRAIVDEFRRLHPGLYRRVHLHAARYHLDRLRELEGSPPAAPGPPGAVDEAAAFDYQPAIHPTDRLRWPDYQAALGEWLYHVVALSPRRGFARLADYVGEALAWGYPTQATALLEIGVEITLPASEALTRQRLLEVARAMHHDRHADTLQLLDEFAAAGSASTIADAGAFFLAGTRLVLLGRSPLNVHANFERAEKLLAGAVDGGMQTRSLRCLNLTRLARELARRDKGGEAALNMLTSAAGLAETCDPRMAAEVGRTRGLILAGLGRLDDALAACDDALEPLHRIGAAAEAALVLGLRADVNLTSGRPAAARRDLLRARSIYRQLVDPEAEAQVLVGLLDIAIREGDAKEAAEQEQAIALLRPDDPLLRNQIGILYFRADRQPEAVDRYTAALAGAPEPAIYANRGRALLKWAIAAGPVDVAGRLAAEAADRAAELRGRAREDLAAAFKGDGDDLDTGIDLAELERELGDAPGSRTTAGLVADRALEAARTLAPSPAAAATDASSDERAALVHRLRDIFVRALTLLEPAKAAELLTAWTADLPDDEELELMRAVAGHDLSAADRGGSALPAAIEAAERAARATDESRGRAFVELAALHAQARHWSEAKAAVERASRDDSVGVQAEYMRDLINDMHRRDDEFGGEPEALVQQLVVEIAESLSGWFDPGTQVGADFFGWMIDVFRRTRGERVGLAPPRLWVGVRKDVPPGTVRVLIDNRVRVRATVEDDLLALAPPEECASLLARGGGLDPGGRAGSPPWSDAPATWLAASAAPGLGAAGVACWDPRGLVLALLDQALEAHPRFVSIEEAAELSGEAWEDVAPSEFIARADVVRKLLAARVPPGDDLRAVLAAHRAAAPADQPSIIAAAIGRLAVAPAPPDRLAEAFAVGRLRRPARSPSADGRPVASITVGGPAPGPHPEAEQAGRIVLDRLCGDLFLPLAELRVERDPTLADGAISVSVGGVTRLVARPADDLDWWRCHPDAGSAGRTGVLAGGLAGRVARAVEAVLWDDPALLFPDAEAAREALAGAIGTTPSQRLAAALLENLGRRVPLGPPDRLKRAYDHVRDRSHSGTVRLPAARTFVSTPRRPVPDNLLFGIRDTIHVDETGRLRQFGVRVQLHHDDDSDLRVSLTSPSGRTVVLHDRGHDLGALRTGVEDDRLPALAPLRDEYAEGDWTLHVQDLQSRDGGLLEEWSIELTTVSSNPGQPPPTAAPTVALTSHEREALARCESLERDLRSRRIDIECGAALWAALEDNGRRQQEKLRLGALIAREVGLHFGHATEFTRAEDLTDDGFRIVINGLVRAAGELPPGRYGPVAVGSDPGSADLWVGPLSRLTYRRLPGDALGGFDAPDRLARHARAAAREAAAEFADADWASAVLDRLGHTYPITVAAVRSAAGEALLASVLRELVTQGIAVTDPRLMELVRELVRSPELARECEALAAAHPAHIGRTAGAMAEWLRGRLGRAETPSGVPLVELGPEIERAVREAVGACADRVPVYALANAAAVLSRLEDARIGLGAAEIAVVTAASIRRHVHRLISAQFPTAQVIAREELDSAVPRQLVDVALGEPVGAGG